MASVASFRALATGHSFSYLTAEYPSGHGNKGVGEGCQQNMRRACIMCRCLTQMHEVIYEYVRLLTDSFLGMCGSSCLFLPLCLRRFNDE